MDVVLDTFQVASFRGVSFLFREQTQTGGRKQKIYEYPNRDTRFVEDLGQLQRTYKLTATIADNSANYQNSKFALIDALEKEGAGVLIHPTDGVKNVFSLPYTLNESITHIGTAEFHLTFVETGAQLFPDESPSADSTIFQQLNNLIETMNANFASIWATLAKFQGQIQYSASLIQAMIDGFTNASLIVTNDVNAYSDFTDNINNLTTNKYTFTTDATALVDNAQALFDNCGELGETSSDNLLIMESFFNYNPIAPVIQRTVQTDQREKNRLMANQLMNAMSLGYYYLFIADTTFSDESDVINQKNIVNEQFAFIVNNNTFTDLLGNSSLILNGQTLTILEDLRINANDSLDAQIAASRRVVDINVKSDSLLSLTYAYYNSLDFYDDLFTLNMLTSAANLSGDFKMLTDEN